MNHRLETLLTALTDTRTYARQMRTPWFALVILYLFAIAITAGIGYTLVTGWTTLLVINLFAQGFSSSLSVLMLIFLYARIATVPTSSFAYSAKSLTLAHALRRALAAGSDAVAPVLATPPQGAELRALVDAPRETAPLVVAIPDLLIISRGIIIGLYLLSALLLLLAGGGVALVTVSFNAPLQQIVSSSGGALALAGFGGSLALLALFTFIRGIRLGLLRLRQRRGITVEVDSLGLRFHQPVWEAQPSQLAWTELRALASFTYKDWYTRTHTIYILTSDERALVWEEPPTDRYASQRDKQIISDLQQSAWSLATAITTRTGLPLRDLTTTIATITGRSSASSEAYRATSDVTFLNDAYDLALEDGDVAAATALWRWKEPDAGRLPRALQKLIAIPPDLRSTFATAEASPVPQRFETVSARFKAARSSYLKTLTGLLDLARALIPYAPAEDAARLPASIKRILRRDRLRYQLHRSLEWLSVAAIISLLIAIPAYWYSEGVMTTRLNAIPRQTQAQAPLYFASLTSRQSDWPVRASTPADPSIAIFSGGGYQISSSDANAPVQFWIPQQVHGDVAISLTMRVTDSGAQNFLLMSGMLFDVADNGNAYSMFGVDGCGNWILSRVDATRATSDSSPVVAIGSNAAIHTGKDATNTLLLVRHSPLYLLYVNGVLISRSFDSKRMLGSSGAVGVYIEDGSVTARFNNFAIYPIPPQLAAISLPTQLPPWLLND